jgi:hypothetical protein
MSLASENWKADQTAFSPIIPAKAGIQILDRIKSGVTISFLQIG